MKILILTQYYLPETGAPQNRLSDLAKRLQISGHQVEVLTSLPNYPDNKIYPGYEGKENNSDIVEGITVCRVGVMVPLQKTFWGRVKLYLSFVYNAICYGPKMIKPMEIILMESPPLFIVFAGVFLAKKYKAKLISNISDLWPQSAIEMGALRSKLLIWLSYKLEEWMYASSDLITGQTEGIVRNIQRRMPSKKVVLFPNGINIETYKNMPNRSESRKRLDWPDDSFVVGYAGVLGHAQKLDQILEAAKILKNRSKALFFLIGDGPCRDHLLQRIKDESLGNVEVLPRVSAAEIWNIYAAMDAGCVPLGKEDVFKGARPSKLFEIMGASLPVLLCAAGEAVSVLGQCPYGVVGLVSPPEDPVKLAENVLWLESHREDGLTMGKHGRKYVMEKFDRAVIAKKLENDFLSLLKQDSE